MSPKPGKRNYPGRFLSHFPLRVSLVVVMTVLAALGLATTAAVSTSILQRFMISRVDDQLANAGETWAHQTTRDRYSALPPGIYPGQTGVDRPPTDFFVRVVDGPIIFEPLNSVFTSMPELRGLEEPTPPTTVPARAGSESTSPWRAASVQNEDGTVTIIALPLEAEEHTIARLVYLQVIIGLIVLTTVMAASTYLVRRALKPLNQVEKTASLISQGKLGSRVPNWEKNTEVGRLSQAFNRMVAQIQGAFMAVAASERQARKSEAGMRRFIGDASHELRTPLTSVRGYAELYKSGATQDADMVIDRISEEAERMGLLVEDLLALVRMDEGRPLRNDRVDMLEVVLAVAEGSRASFPERSITVTNEYGAIPVVMGDANRMHQVLSNLVTNALRHGGEEAHVKLVLRRGNESSAAGKEATEDGKGAGGEAAEQRKNGHSGERVLIDVCDDGQGIPADALPHIFERFYRPDGSRARSSGGSGLGLSIAKGLVEAHGGSITVRSTTAPQAGHGTVFSISLPAAPEDAPEHI